jgi:thiamine transport system substrate-binding protein
MFVFPANSRAELPDVFARFAEIPDQPISILPDRIESSREAWIQDWTRTVLR